MKMNKKKMIFALCIAISFSLLAYTAFSTKLYADPADNFTSFVDKHNLESNEIIFGYAGFNIKGRLPVYITNIEIISEMENSLDFQTWLFYPDRQKVLMCGGEIEYDDFYSYYGENLYPLNSIGWLKDKRFEVVVISRSERIEKTWVKVEYRVGGMLKKGSFLQR